MLWVLDSVWDEQCFYLTIFTCVWWPCSCVWSAARLPGVDAPDGLKHVWRLFSCGLLSVDSGASVLNTTITSGADQCRLAFKVVTKDQHQEKERRIPYRLMLLKTLLVKFVLAPFD